MKRRKFYGPPKVELACDIKCEDYDWLPCDFAKGSVFYIKSDPYKVITPYGMPCSFSPDPKAPYFELPKEHLKRFIGYVHSLN